ncbi:MAG: translation initiation factor [Bacteroidetes bacterium]|nr:translation initiation factor [Bacteroidota bacterium]
MAKSKSGSGLVYSTNPELRVAAAEEVQPSLPKEQQRLRVVLDRKQRAGKVVTLVEHFVGSDQDLQELGKLLKNKCGTGGSAKDGLILIQGDCRDKVLQLLKEWGYGAK